MQFSKRCSAKKSLERKTASLSLTRLPGNGRQITRLPVAWWSYSPGLRNKWLVSHPTMYSTHQVKFFFLKLQGLFSAIIFLQGWRHSKYAFIDNQFKILIWRLWIFCWERKFEIICRIQNQIICVIRIHVALNLCANPYSNRRLLKSHLKSEIFRKIWPYRVSCLAFIRLSKNE